MIVSFKSKLRNQNEGNASTCGADASGKCACTQHTGSRSIQMWPLLCAAYSPDLAPSDFRDAEVIHAVEEYLQTFFPVGIAKLRSLVGQVILNAYNLLVAMKKDELTVTLQKV